MMGNLSFEYNLMRLFLGKYSIFPQDCKPFWQKGFSKFNSNEIL